MSEKFDENMNRKLRRTLNFTLFFTYFFHMGFILVVIGIVLIVIGLFGNKSLIYAGLISFVIDALISFTLMNHFKKIQSQNPEFNRFMDAMNGDNPYQDLGTLTDEWGGEGLYKGRVELITEEVSECKTVKEAFGVYKNHSMALGNPSEEFITTIKTEKYFDDNEKHFVISFVRQREINDDVLVNLYIDLLYEPGTKSPMLNKTFHCSEFSEKEEYFRNIEEYLKENDLWDLKIGKTNVGTDE